MDQMGDWKGMAQWRTSDYINHVANPIATQEKGLSLGGQLNVLQPTLPALSEASEHQRALFHWPGTLDLISYQGQEQIL